MTTATEDKLNEAPVVTKPSNVLGDVATQRELAEVQAQMIIARRFPRNEAEALEKIKIACQRPSLAEVALRFSDKGGK